MLTRIEKNTAIVYSKSLEVRDFLRSRINEFGLNSVCFEKETTCFDNFRPIQPRVVIVHTDSYQVAWRFVFALRIMAPGCPLVFVSNILDTIKIQSFGVKLPIYLINSFSLNDRDKHLLSKIALHNETIVGDDNYPPLLGQHIKIKRIRDMLPNLVSSRDAVFITGEKGTGKEFLVRLMAQMAIAEKAFIKIECGELSPSMVKSGWLKRILKDYSNARQVVVFLNAIHLAQKQIQAEFLLTMEAIEGWKAESHALEKQQNIRFLATSEVPGEDLVKDGKFRNDLFYRLNVIPVSLPPLRERKGDIGSLMDFFIIQAALTIGKCSIIPSQHARNTLLMYDWPGNVGELKKYMHRVADAGSEECIFANSNMPAASKDSKTEFLLFSDAENLPRSHEIRHSLLATGDISLKNICEAYVARTEKKLMQKALETTNWNRKKAAKLFNISYKSLLNKIKVYDIA